VGADRVPLAVVVPTGWTEADDAGSDGLVRHVTYTLTLVVRDEDATARFQGLDRLTSVAQDAIDGSDLGGVCLSALTRLRSGRHDPASPHPEGRSAITGTFAYLIPSPSGHDASA